MTKTAPVPMLFQRTAKEGKKIKEIKRGAVKREVVVKDCSDEDADGKRVRLLIKSTRPPLRTPFGMGGKQRLAPGLWEEPG